VTRYADLLLHWCKTNVVIVAPVVVFAAAFGAVASIELTSLTPFCGTCHSMHTVYSQWERSSHARPAVGKQVGCSDCHVRDGVIGLVQDHIVNGTLQLFAEYTHSHVPARPTVVTAMHDERCVSCHRSVASRDDELSDARLPERLKAVGLVVPHRNHYELREYTAGERRRLQELRTKSSTTRGEQEELVRLEKVERGNCAQCHAREIVQDDGTAEWPKDRSVHLQQPMTCMSCHRDVVHVFEDPLGRPIPSRHTCTTCHDGSYHGKLGVIFAVGCAGGAPPLDTLSPAVARDCMKCHPKIQDLYVRRARAATAGK